MGGAAAAAVGSGLLVCLALHAAAAGEPTPIDITDEYYGTHFGDLQGWVQGNSLPAAPSSQPDSSLSPPAALPASGPRGDGEKRRRWGRVYVTYTKLNKKTLRYYSGRTSMVVDLDRSRFAQAVLAVLVRNRNHHIDENIEPGDEMFDEAAMDRFDAGGRSITIRGMAILRIGEFAGESSS